MKDAVGSTMLVYIVIIVVGIVGSILIASNMYTSAYKAKNNVVSAIDRYYQVHGNTDCFGGESSTCINDINDSLKSMGYRVKKDNLCVDVFDEVRKKAKQDAEGNVLVDVDQVYEQSAEKGYCIFKVSLDTTGTEYYYTVVTFSHLNINALGIDSLFSTPVYGETRTFYGG